MSVVYDDGANTYMLTGQAAQDHADGAALRRLREALPEGWSCVTGWNPLGPHWWCEVYRSWDQHNPAYLSRDGATIAEAVDKCREALGA